MNRNQALSTLRERMWRKRFAGKKNLINVTADTVEVGKYISSSGDIVTNNNNFYSTVYVAVKPNTQYTLSASESLYFASLVEYKADKTFLVRNTKSSPATPFTITTGADTYYLRFGSNMKNSVITIDDVLAVDWMLVEGG